MIGLGRKYIIGNIVHMYDKYSYLTLDTYRDPAINGLDKAQSLYQTSKRDGHSRYSTVPRITNENRAYHNVPSTSKMMPFSSGAPLWFFIWVSSGAKRLGCRFPMGMIKDLRCGRWWGRGYNVAALFMGTRGGE